MSEAIKILQLGTEDWNQKYRLPSGIQLQYEDTFEEKVKKPYDIVFIDRELSDEEVEFLYPATKSYTLFVTEEVCLTNEMTEFFICRKGCRIDRQTIQTFLQQEARNFFPGHYGEKFNHKNLTVAQGFAGDVQWNGNYSVTLQGEYGNDYSQILYWRNNIPIDRGQALELWLEYKKDPNVEIMLSVTHFVNGSLSNVQQKWSFTERQLKDVVIIDNQAGYGPIFVSVLAKGKGKLEVIALHDRYSRRGYGAFLPGGERYVTSNREEVFCYFDPGDRKPPLNVYFSGYKTRQGFEGYNLMRKMGSPFLLIAEPRLEGGCFYMGDEEYEKLIPSIVKKYMKELNFSSNEVVMAGLSMGTFGAMYYGCDILPHAILLGKPLASIGNVAANERINRPGGFATSLDILGYIGGNMGDEAISNVNEKFWNKFDKADWSHSKFVVSYMIEDDYDSDAYNTLISHLHSEGVQLYGKGIHGRHNDDTSAIVGWFSSQFRKILIEDFGRRYER